ncbi:MAG: hypothetical protein MJ146_02855 [Clostridia bacterium]|nr:hypothetical protein [Clostridia bacterium]
MEEYEILTKEEFEREHQDAYNCDEARPSMIKSFLNVILMIFLVMFFISIGFGIFKILILFALFSFIASIITKSFQ